MGVDETRREIASLGFDQFGVVQWQQTADRRNAVA
jgi:hypothetical protein